MRQMHAIFASDPERVVPLSGASDTLHAQWFHEAYQSGTVGARAVIGLWRVDKAAPQEDVIAIYGSVPIDIKARYDVWRQARH